MNGVDLDDESEWEIAKNAANGVGAGETATTTALGYAGSSNGHTLLEVVLARLPTWALRIQTGTGRLRMRRDTPSSLSHVALVSPRLKYMAPMARGQHTFARSHQASTGYGYYTEGQLRKKLFLGNGRSRPGRLGSMTYYWRTACVGK
jgi:hypothetical protein